MSLMFIVLVGFVQLNALQGFQKGFKEDFRGLLEFLTVRNNYFDWSLISHSLSGSIRV